MVKTHFLLGVQERHEEICDPHQKCSQLPSMKSPAIGRFLPSQEGPIQRACISQVVGVPWQLGKRLTKSKKKHGEPTGTNYYFSQSSVLRWPCLPRAWWGVTRAQAGCRTCATKIWTGASESSPGTRKVQPKNPPSNTTYEYVCFFQAHTNSRSLHKNITDGAGSQLQIMSGGVNMFKAALVCEKPPNVHPKAA